LTFNKKTNIKNFFWILIFGRGKPNKCGAH